MSEMLRKRGLSGEQLILATGAVALVGRVMVILLLERWVLTLPMLLVVMAFGLAILNLLGSALTANRDCLGTEGALLGLLYYLVIGGGLTLVVWGKNLG